MGNDVCPRCYHPMRLHTPVIESSGPEGATLTDLRCCLIDRCRCTWTLPQWDEMNKQMSLPETKP